MRIPNLALLLGLPIGVMSLSGNLGLGRKAFLMISACVSTQSITNEQDICERSGAITAEEALPGAYQNRCNAAPTRRIPIQVKGKEVDLNLLQNEAAAGSTGVTIWNSSLLLARLLQALAAKKSSFFEGKEVIELGCGVGLTSLAVGLLGASSVLATDRNPSVLELASQNIERNGLATKIATKELSWGLLDAMDLSDSADLIIGSDLTYNSGNWPVLAETMATILKKDGHILYLSLGHPGFNVNSEIDGFLSVAKAKGLVLLTPLSKDWPLGDIDLESLTNSCISPEERRIVQSTGGYRVILLGRKL